MLRFRAVTVFSLCLSLMAGLAASQQKPEAGKKGFDTAGDSPSTTTIPNLTIEVEKREKIVGIPPGMPTIAPTLPLENGGLLLRYVNLPTSAPDPSQPFRMDPVLVRIKSAQETIRFDDSYPGLSGAVSSGRIAVSKDEVVLLVRAITNDEKLNAPQTQPHPFLIIYDLNGRVKKIAPVNTDPSANLVGVFGDGEILISDTTVSDRDSFRKHLRVFDDKGEFQKELFQQNPNIEFDKGDAKALPAGEIIAAFPYGENILAVHKSARGLLLEELNPSGAVRQWDLVLPKKTAALHLIPSDGPYWLVSYEKAGESTSDAHHADGIFEFDKATSEPVANLTSSSPGILIGAVCQHSGEIVGLLNDPKDYSAELALARIGGK